MRAFVRYQQALASIPELKRRLDALQQKYDAQFKEVFDAIRALIEPEPKPPRRIGFRPEEAMRETYETKARP